MKHSIGTNIQQLRRARCLTQEQLADAVGVSAAAVSKWETGAACPDLLLMAPLARLLGTDLNHLMDFQPQLTDQEAQALTQEYSTLFEQGRAEEASRLSEQLLHQYPNDLWLKFYVSSLYLTYLQDADHAAQLLEPCLDSPDELLRANATYVLAGLLCHGPQRDLERARQLLDGLSFPQLDVRALKIALLAEQGDLAQAEQLARAALEENLSDAVLCLQFLAKSAQRQKDFSKARTFLDQAEALCKAADVPCFPNLLSVRLVSACLYCETGDRVRALQEVERMSLEAENWAGASRQTPHCRYTLHTLAQAVRAELSMLQNDPRFAAALERLAR